MLSLGGRWGFLFGAVTAGTGYRVQSALEAIQSIYDIWTRCIILFTSQTLNEIKIDLLTQIQWSRYFFRPRRGSRPVSMRLLCSLS